MCDSKCICKGNWREIVKESEPFFGRTYVDERGKVYRLFGIVHAEDDYYYGLMDDKGKLTLASCVGSLETNGFTLTAKAHKIQTSEERLIEEIFGKDTDG